MPIYEYQCDGCQAVFEVFQKVSDPAPRGHSCGSTQVHRILSNTSFVLKGTGWYATDYADKSKKSDEGHNSKGHKKPEGAQTPDAKSSQSAEKISEGSTQSSASKTPSTKGTPSGKGSAPA